MFFNISKLIIKALPPFFPTRQQRCVVWDGSLVLSACLEKNIFGAIKKK